MKEKEEKKKLVLQIRGRRCCQSLEVLSALLGCSVLHGACRCRGRKKGKEEERR